MAIFTWVGLVIWSVIDDCDISWSIHLSWVGNLVNDQLLWHFMVIFTWVGLVTWSVIDDCGISWSYSLGAMGW